MKTIAESFLHNFFECHKTLWRNPDSLSKNAESYQFWRLTRDGDAHSRCNDSVDGAADTEAKLKLTIGGGLASVNDELLDENDEFNVPFGGEDVMPWKRNYYYKIEPEKNKNA